MPIYSVTPNDVLFFRDGRPMTTEGGSGHGARWAEPSIWFDAIHAALYRAFPEKKEWEHEHRFGKSGRHDDNRRDQRFGSLTTLGPFPVVADGQWLFPTPADIAHETADGLPTMKPMSKCGSCDLPAPLSLVLSARSEPSKESAKPWRTKVAIEAYLRAEACEGGRRSDGDIFGSEWSTGIRIDPEKRAQDGKSIYSAEYLRLKPEVRMGAGAWMPLKKCNGEEGMGKLFEDRGHVLIMGGQQRMCHVLRESGEDLGAFLPIAPELPAGTVNVKWVLLSPAVFQSLAANPEKEVPAHPGGWLPNWVNPETGRVGLKTGPGENKAGRLKARGLGVEPGAEIGATLVAARIPKPIAISGWSERLHELRANADPEARREAAGATGTVLAVPAGAVYYFQADSPQDAKNLAAALSWHGAQRSGIARVANRRSGWFGEKGFGLGVCGRWEAAP